MICDKVHKAGGRFLEKRDNSSTHESFWDEIKVRAAQLKTSQALRDARSDVQPLPQEHGTLEETPESVAEMLDDPSTQGIDAHDTTIAVGGLKNDCTFEQGLSIQESNTEDRHWTDVPWDGKFFPNAVSRRSVILKTRPHCLLLLFHSYGNFVETQVRDTVLQNALVYKDNHQQHDYDLEHHAVMLSPEPQQSPYQETIARISTDTGTDKSPIALPLHFVTHQRSELDNAHFDCNPVDTMKVNGQNDPMDPLLKPTLREQLSGDSHEWIADLWSATNYCSRSHGQLDGGSTTEMQTVEQGPYAENPTNALPTGLGQKRFGAKTGQRSSVASKKAKQNLQTESPCALPLREQLSGDSHAWVSFDLLTQNQKPDPHFMPPDPRGPFLPSDSRADQLDTNYFDPWPLSVAFPTGDAMKDPPLAPTLTTEFCTASFSWKNVPNPAGTLATKPGAGSSIRTLQDEPLLGDLNGFEMSIEALNRSIRTFRCVMPEARKVEMEFQELVSKVNGDYTLPLGTPTESGINISGVSEQTLPTHVAV